MKYLLVVLLFAACNTPVKKTDQDSQAATTEKATGPYTEQHRPQIHFSPKAHWMNDPNGLIMYNGVYHLFFQYYPDSTVWGPMHWGHATSSDLMHWKEKDIALYPDQLGYIFSGSAVVDHGNTSGFAKDGKTPLVAIFTYHDPKGADAKRNDYQSQGLAYSLDEGNTWTKYDKNPVLKNPGIIDFRDPKVMWYAPARKWIMTLATKDRITFYSSPDLKNWTKESEFGENLGAHGGVWECPDLFPIVHDVDTVWILFVSINPGGPNGGSATQYFTGEFDGKKFTTTQTDTRWLDYGPDNYAGVTWSNVGRRRLFLGWMSNWNYGQQVPTSPWRSAMTIPRDIGITKVGDRYMLTSTIPGEVMNQITEGQIRQFFEASDYDLTEQTGKLQGPSRIRLTSTRIAGFSLTLSNEAGDKLVIGYDKRRNVYFIDRSKSGAVDFEKSFAAEAVAPRISTNDNMDMELIIDNASVELFADGGLSVMTAIFFPREAFTDVRITSNEGFKIERIMLNPLKRIW